MVLHQALYGTRLACWQDSLVALDTSGIVRLVSPSGIRGYSNGGCRKVDANGTETGNVLWLGI